MRIKSQDKVRREVAGLSGYYNQMNDAIFAINSALQKCGFDCETEIPYYGDKGRIFLPLFKGENDIDNVVSISFYRMPSSFNWEIVCYVSL